jgi:hypothetical protein
VLAAAEQHSLLTVSARRISFRHELTRRAIAGPCQAARLMALNQRVLDVLVKDATALTFRRSSIMRRKQATPTPSSGIRPGGRTGG